ncbi:MAG: hypothetical protein H0T62_09020 [Parachlamydiaceae bacterium]|nr:hypothetical protein [Parachlamydiaceae bacterium]
MLPVRTSINPGTNIDSIKNHKISHAPIDDQKTQEHTTPNKEQTDSAKLAQAKEDRKQKISEGFKRQAELLDQISTSDQVTDPQNEYKYGEAKGYRPVTEVVREVAKEVLYQLGKVLIVLSFISMGAEIHSGALIGASMGVTSSEQLSSGAGYLWENLQLGSIEAKLEILNKQIRAVTDPNDPRLPTYKAQKFQLENQIEKQKAAIISEGFALVQSNFMNTLNIGLTLLQLAPATDKVAQYTAGAGGLGMSLISFGYSIKGISDNVDAYIETNKQLGDLGRTQVEESTPEKVKNTLDLMDLAAIDYAANHQKDQIKVGIFQSAFSTCSSVASIAAGIIGILFLANVAGVTGAAIASGIGMPVLGGVGVLITGAIYVVRNRKSIARGINGFFAPGEKSLKDRLNLKQNLDVREWYARKDYKNAVQEMHKLSFERSALLKTGMTETSEKIIGLNNQMLEKASELDEYETKLNDTLYKKAKQSAKDNIPTIKEAQQKAIEANKRAISAVNSELVEAQKNIELLGNSNFEQAKKAFISLNSNKINELEAKLEKVKAIQAKIQPLESLYNQMLGRKISDWKKILGDGYDLLFNAMGPRTEEDLKERFKQKWEENLAEIDHRLMSLEDDDIEGKDKLNNELKKINLYLSDPTTGLQEEKDRLEKMETALILDIKKYKLNADEPENRVVALIEKFKSQFMTQKENLENEKMRLEFKKEKLKLPIKLDDMNIPLKEIKLKSVKPEEVMVVEALEQNIDKLDEEELRSLKINSKKRGINFDQLDKADSLSNQKLYIKIQIMNAIANGQIKATG